MGKILDLLFIFSHKRYSQKEKRKKKEKESEKALRTNVTNSQTFGGNSSNIDFVHILQLDKP